MRGRIGGAVLLAVLAIACGSNPDEIAGFPKLNGTDWAATDPQVAAQFEEFLAFGVVEFELVVEAEPRRLQVTSHGITVEYLPVDQPVSC